MPDFSSYLPPGVYIEEEASSAVNAVGVTPTVVALVGPSVGYRESTETVVLTGTEATLLSQLGINDATVVVRAADGTAYDASDFELVADGGEDENLATTTDNTLTLARTDDSTIPDDGSPVYVSYQYTDATYYEPLRVRDFDEVIDAFGPPIDATTGAITSPLSFAAKLALDNQAAEVVLVTTSGSATSTSRAQLQAGLAKLETMFDVNIVVPLPVGITGSVGTPGDTTNIPNDLKTHCDAMSADGLYRLGVVGFGAGVTRPPDAIAEDIASKRVSLVWPNRVLWYNGFANTSVEVPGVYLAAAVAGRLASLPVQMPLTKKPVRGFSSFPSSVLSTMTKAAMNSWSDAGVLVVEQDRGGRLQVRHGTTTDRSSVDTREISLVRAKDALVRLLQETTESSGIIGTPIGVETNVRVKAIVQGALETAVSSEVIVSYQDLKVRARPADPTVIEVRFAYLPAYPLNYIVITFAINTATGDIIAQAA